MSDVLPALQDFFACLGFSHTKKLRTGSVYENKANTCIIVDIDICSLKNYHYVDYTTVQNSFFAHYSQVFRFLYETDKPFQFLEDEINIFFKEMNDPETIRQFGRNRTDQDIDPSRPEAIFENSFISAFGESNRGVLYREFPYIDCAGKNRFIDYALFTTTQKFAIELNGESFHHPAAIGAKKYRSQLFKQNSLVSDGFKIFRWSEHGMRDQERFIQELKLFLGSPTEFIPKAHLKIDRQFSTIDLHDHQLDSLEYLRKERSGGRRNFLIVLPTGTGKTEIFIKDIEILKNDKKSLKALILVPSRKLRTQTIERFKARLPKYRNIVGDDCFGKKEIVVQTYAFIHRHYFKVSREEFDYIVVDEAHHAPAAGLRRVLEYFNPCHLLGVTATPERFDQRSLEEIFGRYESTLTLKEAIEQNLIPPIRCYRIRSNIDLSMVRFNGREYVRTDLQRTLHVPSRDVLIIEILKKYFSNSFSNKQGVVFCVDIQHAKRMANALNKQGISALDVDGRDRKKADHCLQQYNDGEVRFLCACDLLTEGWDAPQTSILVMARPTFSKVLYTQQLGRGLRHYPGKEALYVLDVVDNYGAKLSPMSLHALLGVNQYRPFENVVGSQEIAKQEEITILDGLYEGIRRVEPVDIFTFENLYGDFLNEEQLARELFVSTSTVKNWLKKGRIQSDHSHPFGRSTLHFFAPDKIDIFRQELKLSEHSEKTRKKDFLDFLEKRDYVFSYKIIFLLSFLKVRNNRHEAQLPDMLSLYQKFYLKLLEKYGQNERSSCPYNQEEYLQDKKELLRSLLSNPFEKFERKRFFHHCRDLNYIGLDSILASQLEAKNYRNIIQQMGDDLKKYYLKQDIKLENSDFSFLVPNHRPIQGDRSK
jgi:superfamily II DNA or RNA helicase